LPARMHLHRPPASSMAHISRSERQHLLELGTDTDVSIDP
jgi:hypothetical protein